MIQAAFIAALHLHTVVQVPAEPQIVNVKECVVLLHGLGRTVASMRKMEEALTSAGYAVANVAYASRKAPIEELARTAVSEGLERCRNANAEKINFVTHSLGGILLRYYLEKSRIDELHRSVMLAPPNQGSAAVDVYRRLPGYRLINGEAGLQLGTKADSIPLKLGPVGFDLGIVAGDRTIDPLTSKMLSNPDDGKVSVASTKVDGMNDFLLVHHSHAFIMKSNEVIRQTKHYLAFGHFDHAVTSAGSTGAAGPGPSLAW